MNTDNIIALAGAAVGLGIMGILGYTALTTSPKIVKPEPPYQPRIAEGSDTQLSFGGKHKKSKHRKTKRKHK